MIWGRKVHTTEHRLLQSFYFQDPGRNWGCLKSPASLTSTSWNGALRALFQMKIFRIPVIPPMPDRAEASGTVAQR